MKLKITHTSQTGVYFEYDDNGSIIVCISPYLTDELNNPLK